MTTEHKYRGALTREQFLFPETRITAKLKIQGLETEEIIEKIVDENLFQYPTEKTINSIAKACLRRLGFVDENLVHKLANGAVQEAKQISLYALMKDNKLVWDFMINVIGEKYRNQDLSFSNKDIYAFTTNMQEQNLQIAGWTDETIKKIRVVLKNILLENDYVSDAKSQTLNYVLLNYDLEMYIKKMKDNKALIAFNFFE